MNVGYRTTEVSTGEASECTSVGKAFSWRVDLIMAEHTVLKLPEREFQRVAGTDVRSDVTQMLNA